MEFSSSHKKIQRANKHISDLNTMLRTFGYSNCYSASIDYDPERRINFLCVNLREESFPLDEAALIIGDALHNLRSALDLMYYQIVSAGEGSTTRWTRFPIFDVRDELVGRWKNSAKKQKQITDPILNFIIDDIKPYKAGNFLLWACDSMNIRDKHELLIPVLKLVGLFDLCLENEEGMTVGSTGYLMHESFRIHLSDANGGKVTIKNEGHASMTIFFGEGTPFPNESVSISLLRIAEEITRTIDTFETLNIPTIFG